MPEAAKNARIGAELAGVAIGLFHDGTGGKHGGVVRTVATLASPTAAGTFKFHIKHSAARTISALLSRALHPVLTQRYETTG